MGGGLLPAVTDYLVGYSGVLAGDERRFDQEAFRGLVRREVQRARNIAAFQNHDAIPDGDPTHQPVSSITVPTLVIHGTADPMFPIDHAEALVAEIPNATLLPLDGAGHGLVRDDWDTVVHAIAEHTAFDRLRR